MSYLNELPAKLDAPFFLRNQAGDCAVLLVHGLTGTPYEMRGLGAHLFERGFTVHGLCLPGHESEATMTGVGREDWRRAVRQSYRDLRRDHERVALVGLSTGGLLSLDLASDEDSGIDAVVSLAAPMFLYGFKARYLLPIIGRTPLRTRMKWVKESPGNIKDPEARSRHHSLKWTTVDAVNELRRLIREVRRELPKVRCPLLVVHGRDDSTALVKSDDIVYDHAGSVYKEKVILSETYHVMTVDLEKDRVFDDVTRFLQRWLRPSP